VVYGKHIREREEEGKKSRQFEKPIRTYIHTSTTKIETFISEEKK
jgi:hypothetical protein